MRWMSREEQSATNYNTDGFTYCSSHLITNIWFNPDECGFDLTHTRTSCILRLVTVLVPTPPDVTTPDQQPILMQLVRLNLACSSNIKASLFRCLFVFSLYLGLWLDCQYRGSLGAGKHFNSLSSHLIRCNSLHQNKFSSWGCSWSFAFWWNWKGSCKLETGPGTGRLNICPDRQYQTILPFSSHSREHRRILESSTIKWIISHVV